MEQTPSSYQLSGILVHSGTSDSGHYYSFIKERSTQPFANWFQFNDDAVSPFNCSEISFQCFGGFNESMGVNLIDKNNRFKMKPYNAYMLFYDRVDTLTKSAIPSEDEMALSPSILK